MTDASTSPATSPATQRLLEQIADARAIPAPDRRPDFVQCRPRVLVVADLNLDHSLDNHFGLGIFAMVLLDMKSPADPIVTLAHMGCEDSYFLNDARIARIIKNFHFDNPNHFGTDLYDVVFVFGFSDKGRNLSGDDESLHDTELDAIARYMNAGGGLFATGDHGMLGRHLGHRLPRAGRMRLWAGLTGVTDDHEAMRGPNRHDTNHPGHDNDFQFDDQSDDVPQTIQPRVYHRYSAIWRYSYPHPLLCGPAGRITVMPDHPHEGECVEPTETEERIGFGADLGPEFPPATDGGARPLPEVISDNTVFSGNKAKGGMGGGGEDKQPTEAHTFGGLCAYDGHRANVGRVVTDSTWHRFVNTNLDGTGVGRSGLFGSAEGLAHFEHIKAYYHNLVLWLCPPRLIRCINHGWVFELVMRSATVEAITTGQRLSPQEVNVETLRYIGAHARDVLGKVAGQCASRRLRKWIADQLDEAPDQGPLFRDDDPWSPDAARERDPKEPLDTDFPLLNMDTLRDTTLGAALVAVNEAVRKSDEPLSQELQERALREGSRIGIQRARETAGKILEAALKELRN